MSLTVYCIGPDPEQQTGSLQQEAALRGIPLNIVPLVASSASITRELSALQRDNEMLGALLQSPFQQLALAYCQELSPSAQTLGAVTLLTRRSSGLVSGDNADVPAFVAALGEQGVKRVRTALVLGTGRAARISLAGLREMNCARYMVGFRNPRRPAELTAQLRSLRKQLSFFPMQEMEDFLAWWESSGLFDSRSALKPPGRIDDTVRRWDLLVNATPLGMMDADRALVSNLAFLRCFDRVLDMVPREDGTALTRAATAAGVPVLYGHRLAALGQQHALDVWERELKRRHALANGEAVELEPAARRESGTGRVPVLRRQRR